MVQHHITLTHMSNFTENHWLWDSQNVQAEQITKPAVIKQR